MADRKYYVLCESNCKFESMTKEQIIAAIAEATGNTVTDVDAAFITKIKEQNNGAAVKIWVGTQAEYNALVASGDVDNETIYCTSDGSAISLLKAEVERISQTVDDVNEVLQQGITDCNGRIDNAEVEITALENRMTNVEAVSGSGTVPISKGGTGATTVARARYNLGLGNTSGAVPVANGGTGVTSLPDLRLALGLGYSTGNLSVGNGGTGASDGISALANLGIQFRSTTISLNYASDVGFYKGSGACTFNAYTGGSCNYMYFASVRNPSDWGISVHVVTGSESGKISVYARFDDSNTTRTNVKCTVDVMCVTIPFVG